MISYSIYEFPKKGIFKITTNEYRFPEGWVCKEEEYEIIGETDYGYVYKLIESGYDEWVGNKIIQHSYTLPIYIHKSRFVRWATTQLALFT